MEDALRNAAAFRVAGECLQRDRENQKTSRESARGRELQKHGADVFKTNGEEPELSLEFFEAPGADVVKLEGGSG